MTDLPVPNMAVPVSALRQAVRNPADDPCVECGAPATGKPGEGSIRRQSACPLILTRVKPPPDGYCRWESRCPHCREATVDWLFATDGEAFRCPSCGGQGYTALFQTSRQWYNNQG